MELKDSWSEGRSPSRKDVGWGCWGLFRMHPLASSPGGCPDASARPGTCILATSCSILWLASSWLLCKVQMATSRSCSSCSSVLASLANLWAPAKGHNCLLAEGLAGEPQGGWWGPRTSRVLLGPRPASGDLGQPTGLWSRKYTARWVNRAWARRRPPCPTWDSESWAQGA